MKQKKPGEIKTTLYSENTGYAFQPESFDDTDTLLGFLSNGMTNNEKIDEYNYFDHYLEEKPET